MPSTSLYQASESLDLHIAIPRAFCSSRNLPNETSHCVDCSSLLANLKRVCKLYLWDNLHTLFKLQRSFSANHNLDSLIFHPLSEKKNDCSSTKTCCPLSIFFFRNKLFQLVSRLSKSLFIHTIQLLHVSFSNFLSIMYYGIKLIVLSQLQFSFLSTVWNYLPIVHWLIN